MQGPDLEELERVCIEETRAFWDETAKWEDLPRYRRYIQERLNKELELAQKRSRLPDFEELKRKRCDMLVLLVGHSFEPLLQAVNAYRPAEVVPVLNRKYGMDRTGEQMRMLLEDLLDELARADLAPHGLMLRTTPLLDRDTPSEVFRLLQRELREDLDKKTVIIDITGAKKSMVAGAFFFAAYTNPPTSYVDFETYDPNYGRPYGCTCDIGILANPYDGFHLRDWAQVRRLYEQYAFGQACETLVKIRAEMVSSDLYDDLPAKIQSCQRLQDCLTIYRDWDNGDYARAWALYQKKGSFLPEEGVPWAISALGTIWPCAPDNATPLQAADAILKVHFSQKYGAAGPEDSIFDKPGLLLAYVDDELAKVDRLISPKEDYRAAYLRAVNLEEFLLKWRLALCWLHGELVETASVTREDLGGELWEAGFKQLVNESGADAMRRFLVGRYQAFHLQTRGRQEKQFRPRFARMEPRLKNVQPDLLDNWNFRDFGARSVWTVLRGEATHTNLYLTESIARAAVAVTTQARDDFVKEWLEHFYPERQWPAGPSATNAPDWDNLCSWCGIDFLPLYRADERKEGEE